MTADPRPAGLLAALWDMDGVLVETAQFHYIAWKRTMASVGVDVSEETFRRTFGQRNDTVIRDMMGREDIPPDLMRHLSEVKEQHYRDAVKGNVSPLPGAMELLRALKEYGFRCAMASAAPRANVQLILHELQARPFFDAIVTAEDVTRGKPDPQVYLLAAERVGVPPIGCVVLEDAVAGVEGAKAAGMACIGVASNHAPEALAKADLIVDDLTKITAQQAAALIAANAAAYRQRT